MLPVLRCMGRYQASGLGQVVASSRPRDKKEGSKRFNSKEWRLFFAHPGLINLWVERGEGHSLSFFDELLQFSLQFTPPCCDVTRPLVQPDPTNQTVRDICFIKKLFDQSRFLMILEHYRSIILKALASKWETCTFSWNFPFKSSFRKIFLDVALYEYMLL